MEAAGKPPGTNLGDKLLNEPGQPERCCVVLRVAGEDGVTNARARLLDALRAREAAAQNPDLKIVAKARLGIALRKRGYFAESKILLTDVLKAQERTLGAEHPSTLVSVNNLAGCLRAMGQLKDAEPLYRRALEARERTLGAEHPSTLASVNNLALCLRAMGQLKDAELLHRRSLEAEERTLGAEHPETLASVSNLAVCFKAMGRLKDAELLHRRVLEAKERTLGAEHPQTLASVSNLAGCLKAMGQLKDAELLHRRALEARERTLGAEHPETLVSVSNLALCLQVMGRLKDAEPLHRRALEARERTLGAEHPDTLVSVNNLAGCLQAMGQLKDAEPLYRRDWEASERTLGAEHPDTLVSVNNLALCLKDMGQLKDAELLHRKALEAQERTLGAEHPSTLVSVSNLAGCLEAMGRLQDANNTEGSSVEDSTSSDSTSSDSTSSGGFRGDPSLLPTNEYPELVPHRSECVKVMKVWDAKGILESFEELAGDGLFSRVFNAVKNAEIDRQIGVEFALCAHKNLLEDHSLLLPEEQIRGRHVFLKGPRYSGLVYAKEELWGSTEKDLEAEQVFKAVGAEVISDDRDVRSGYVTVGAPVAKSLALSVLSLRAARLPGLSPNLVARLAGNWASILMFRRCLSSVVDDLFAFGTAAGDLETGVVLPLPRKVCAELVVLSCLSPPMCSNLASDHLDFAFASDASLSKGLLSKLQSLLCEELWYLQIRRVSMLSLRTVSVRS
eukprot:s1251_g29.t2